MVITYFGAECFRVQFGSTVLGFNPISKNAKRKGEKAPRFGADIAFVSVSDPHFNGIEQLTLKDRAPFVIAGPGEYENQGVFVKGYPSKSGFGVSEAEAGEGGGVSAQEEKTEEKIEGRIEGKINTIYSAKLEGMHLVFLGALADTALTPETLGDLGEVDILFVPIGGRGVLTASEAYKIAVNLSPKIIIPMHYEGVGALSDALEIFLKEGGKDKPEAKEKLTIKQKDLSGLENEVMVMRPTSS